MMSQHNRDGYLDSVSPEERSRDTVRLDWTRVFGRRFLFQCPYTTVIDPLSSPRMHTESHARAVHYQPERRIDMLTDISIIS